MKRATWNEIQRLGLHDPTIHAWLTEQSRPSSGVTIVDALLGMVMSLYEDKCAMREQLIEEWVTVQPTPVIVDAKESVDAFWKFSAPADSEGGEA